MPYIGRAPSASITKLEDADQDTKIQVEESSDEDIIRFDIAGAEDFRMAANSFNVLSGSTLTIDSGATITNSGTANNFGTDPESAYAGVLQSNANFVDQVIFGPSVDGRAWNGLWNKASLFSSLMLATIEDEGSNTEINIWDLTEQSAGTISTTPLGTVDLSSAATPTAIAACMGYIIVGSEDGIAIIDPHDGSWAERTVGWPRTLTASTTPALVDNDVQAVAATISDAAPYDPRTGGFIPTFACTYGTGAAEASIIKDDGVVYDHTSFTVSAAGAKAVGFIGQEVYFGCENTGDTIRLANIPIAAIQADDWATNNTLKKARYSDNFLGCDGGSASSSYQAVFADSDGLSIYRNPANTASAQEGLTAMVNRTYTTGFFPFKTVGTFLANSKTADRSGNSNTLTEVGTVTEAVVASGAELKGYSGFSTSNYLMRAHDTDFDVGSTSFALSFWMKTSGASAEEQLISLVPTSGAWWGITMTSAEAVRLDTNDGVTPTTSAATVVPTDEWVHIAMTYSSVAPHTIEMYHNGVLVSSTSNSAVGSLTGTAQQFNIGAYDSSSGSPSGPATSTTLALVRFTNPKTSTQVWPTSRQVREMYEAEKGMFVASAECLLQSGSTDAVLSVDIDPLTEKVLVTQTDAITVFKKGGLVVDSKPTVNSGSSEKGRLWGDLRSEQNSANAYVTAPAVDQRQVNEMVRGLASDLPAGVDLSKAKAWCHFQGSSTAAIKSSYNIKSLTDNGTGDWTLKFGIPFKSQDAMAQVSGSLGGSGHYHGPVVRHDSDGFGATGARILHYETGTSTKRDTLGVFVAYFGELENE